MRGREQNSTLNFKEPSPEYLTQLADLNKRNSRIPLHPFDLRDFDRAVSIQVPEHLQS